MKKKKVIKVAPKVDLKESMESASEEASESPKMEAKEVAAGQEPASHKGKKKGPDTKELVGLLKGAMKKPGGALSRSNY